jgi:pilus assembly protein CpaF
VSKTTLLAALLALVTQQERIVFVEDSRELAPNHPDVVRIKGRSANTELAGAISLTDLIRESLRMRPDRLVG